MKGFKFYASAALLSVLVTTSCVDDIESDTISALRQAKVEYMKSQTELEMANVALINAQTALLVQQAEYAKALMANDLAKWEIENKTLELALDQAKRENEAAEIAHKNAMEILRLQNPVLAEAINLYTTYVNKSSDYNEAIVQNKVALSRAEGLLSVTESTGELQIEHLKAIFEESKKYLTQQLTIEKSQLAIYESVSNLDELIIIRDAKTKELNLKNSEVREAFAVVSDSWDDYYAATLEYNNLSTAGTLGQILSEIVDAKSAIVDINANIASRVSDIKILDSELVGLKNTALAADEKYSDAYAKSKALWEAYEAIETKPGTAEEIAKALLLANAAQVMTDNLLLEKDKAHSDYDTVKQVIDNKQYELDLLRGATYFTINNVYFEGGLAYFIPELKRLEEVRDSYEVGEIDLIEVAYKKMIAAEQKYNDSYTVYDDLSDEKEVLQKDLQALEVVVVFDSLGNEHSLNIEYINSNILDCKEQIAYFELQIAQVEATLDMNSSNIEQSIVVMENEIARLKAQIKADETEKAYVDAMAATQKEYIDSQAK